MTRTRWALSSTAASFATLALLGCSSDAGSATASDTAPTSATSGDGAPTATARVADSTPVASTGAAESSSAAALTVASASASPSATSASSAGPAIADPSRLELTGKTMQGGLLFAKAKGAVGRIELPGHRAVVSPEGDFLIAFSRNAPKTEKMTIHFKDGTKLEHVFDIVQRTYDTDTISGLPEDEVTPDPKTRAALKAFEARIDGARMKYSKEACYKDGFIWPASGKITSRYGETRKLNGVDGGVHWGVDIAVGVGTPVKAPACGTVVFAEKDVPLSGDMMILDHGHGLTSSFLHLSGFRKKVGDVVKQGDVIAVSGKSGRATGPHLDWRMSYFEIRIDPELLVPPK